MLAALQRRKTVPDLQLGAIAITFYDPKKLNLVLIEIFLRSFVHGAHEVEGAAHEKTSHQR